MSLQGILESFLAQSLEALEEYHVQCHSLLLELPGLVMTMEYPAFTLKPPPPREIRNPAPEQIDQILVSICRGVSDPLSVPVLKMARERIPDLSLMEFQTRMRRLIREGKIVTKP